MRSPSSPHSASPCFQVSAVFAASASGVVPLRAASAGSIQGWNSAAESPGNASIRFGMSPFGSITTAGMPSSAASSSNEMQRPVLPLPVMPTQTACVVRSRESYTSGSAASWSFAAS
jgi:hypothetical protein